MTTSTMTSTEMSVPVWDLADRIRKARRASGLTQSELAEAIDVKTGLLGSWEAGSNQPRRLVETVTRIASATGVPMHWLLTGEGTRSRWFSQADGSETVEWAA